MLSGTGKGTRVEELEREVAAQPGGSEDSKNIGGVLRRGGQQESGEVGGGEGEGEGEKGA